MRFSVDPWDPAYGTSADDAGSESEAVIDLTVECSAAAWAPVPRPADAPAGAAVVFVDGVRRVDARVWIGGDGEGDEAAEAAEPGLAASWAAGAVRCDGRAEVVAVEVGRGLFSASREAGDLVTVHGTYRRRPATSGTPEHLSLALQQAMTSSEVAVANEATRLPGELLVVDGPLRGRQRLGDAIGLIKTHHTQYLTGAPRAVLSRLAPGERTPVFRIASGISIRHSWYLRLPGGGTGPMAGIVRCECSAELPPDVTIELARWTAQSLPRFASEAHKDARAPQNLYPIGGLERELRRRMGDSRLLYRALRRAAA